MSKLTAPAGSGAAPAATPPPSSRTFPATPDQIPQARRYLASLLPTSPLTHDALTCLSELATNAIQHSNSARPGGHFTVRTALRAGQITVEVQDQGGLWAGHPGPSHERGRGLLIVAALATRWGITTTSTTRTVWFQIDLP